MMRWGQGDPAGYSDALNEYGYVGARTVNARDPEGTLILLEPVVAPMPPVTPSPVTSGPLWTPSPSVAPSPTFTPPYPIPITGPLPDRPEPKPIEAPYSYPRPDVILVPRDEDEPPAKKEEPKDHEDTCTKCKFKIIKAMGGNKLHDDFVRAIQGRDRGWQVTTPSGKKANYDGYYSPYYFDAKTGHMWLDEMPSLWTPQNFQTYLRIVEQGKNEKYVAEVCEIKFTVVLSNRWALSGYKKWMPSIPSMSPDRLKIGGPITSSRFDRFRNL